MITLMIRQVALEQLHRLVELLHQAQSLHHQVNRSDPSTIDSSASFRALVVDVARLEHRFGLFAPAPISQTTLNSCLAIAEVFAVFSFHSKRPLTG